MRLKIESMKFEAYSIHPRIKQNLEAAGFKRPTDIQFKTIPHVLKGEDVLAIAQTGTGKTAAFVIPVLHLLGLTKKKVDGIRCVVMAPTHELALQIDQVFKQLSTGTGIKSLALIGGVDQDPQIEKLQKGIDVLVATPGRLFDLVHQQHLNLRNAGLLILDEADQMLDRGFYKDITDLIRFLPKKRQTLYFSATINPQIKKLAYSLVNNPIRIQIAPENLVSKNITHYVAHIAMDDKRFFLERLIEEYPESKILVFVRTKVRAERVMKAMARVNIHTVNIHSGKTQEERNTSMQLFRSGEVKVLIATDVSARGIDIPNVDVVVNYDLPDKAENYVHRIGRTGRGMQKGSAFSYCSEEEEAMLAEIEEYIGREIEKVEIAKGDYKATLLLGGNEENDWKAVMKKAALEEERYEQKKKRKKK